MVARWGQTTRFPALAWLAPALLLTLLMSCGNGSTADGDGGTSTGRGWVAIDPSAANATDAAFVRLTGTSFISPTWWRCCTGSADDTGVTVAWSVAESGAGGIADHSVRTCSFLWSPSLCDHTWSVRIPLGLGSNTVTIRAYDPGSSSGTASLLLTRTADVTPPTVQAVTPARDIPGVSPFLPATITAQFSEIMLASSITPSTFAVTGPGGSVIAGTVSVNDSFSAGQGYSSSASFRPSAGLAALTTYTATIDGSVADYAGGNAMGQPLSWSFTTGVPVSGRILNQGGTGVSSWGVHVREEATGALSFTQTDAGGNYGFTAPRKGTYTITPDAYWCANCSFVPASITVTVDASELTGQNFLLLLL